MVNELQLKKQNESGKIKVWSGKDPNQKQIIQQWCIENNFTIGDEWINAGIQWLSNGSTSDTPLDIWWYGYIKNPTNRHNFSRHSRMEFGKYCDEGSGYILEGKSSLDQVMTNIYESAKRIIPSNADDTDQERIDYYITICEKYIVQIVDTLMPLKQEYGEIMTQYPIVLTMKGLTVPFIGFADFVFIKDNKISRVVELKTMWPNPRGYYKKDYKDKLQGDRIWTKQSLPVEAKPINLPQLAIYSAGLDHLLDILYVNEDDCVLMEYEDHPEIQWENLTEILKYVRINAITRQNYLSLVDDPTELYQIIQPDFSHWKWRGVEKEFLNDAKNIWLNQKGKV